MRILLLTITASLILAAPTDPKLDVMPKVVFPNGTVRLTCRVPRDSHNRQIELGIEGLHVSTWEMEGEHAPITWQSYESHIDCNVGNVICRVTRDDLKVRGSAYVLTVIGCDSAIPTNP